VTPAPDAPVAVPVDDGGLVASLRGLGRDGRRLFALRVLRMSGYGALSVVLVLYLTAAGLEPLAVGAVLTLTLLGDTAISLWLMTHADRYGRRRVLLAGSLLVTAAGLVFAATDWLPLLVLAGVIGVISPTGNEVGPFLAVEQAGLAQVVPDRRRTATFAWYNLAGYLATAAGALLAGVVAATLLGGGRDELTAYRAVVVGYALLGLAMAAVAWTLGPAIEAASRSTPGSGDAVRSWLGLGRSRQVILKLSALFALDAFAGGFIPLTLIAFYLATRFDPGPATLGALFFAVNLLAAVSSLSAARIAARVGLINTMVFTHLPSNVLLLLVPLMPTFLLAAVVLLARSVISQMDVPTRQSYVIAVVEPDERSAAAGVTGIARTVGAAVSPSVSTVLVSSATLAGLPFLIAGSLKIVYDLLLYRDFRGRRPPEEVAAVRPPPAPPAAA
jgi:MFS family permease